MRGIYGYIPLIVVVVAMLTVAAFIRPISGWIKMNRAISIGAVVGHITHVEGSVRRLHGGDIELLPINQDKPIEVRDGDRIQTSVASKADFSLEDGGGNFEIPQGSGILFERWEPLVDGSPVYMHVLFGSLNGSSPKENYVVKGDKLYFAGQNDSGAALGVIFNASKPAPKHVVAPSLPARPVDDKINPQVLSNEYLNTRIEAAGDELNSCREKAGVKSAALNVKFELGKDGRVHDVKVDDSSAPEELKACVGQVFEKINFRPFSGVPLNADIPLRFE